MRVGMYLRISLDRTGEHLAVDRQREACHLALRRFGDCDVREYLDNSLSASKTRPASSAYAHLLVDAQAGLLDVVVVWDLDRLTRIPREIEDWIDVVEARTVRLVTADGEVDAGTENGRTYMRVKAAFARAEIETKSRRQRAAHAQSRAAGGIPPGAHCFGYTPDGMSIVPSEQAAVQAGIQLILAGGRLKSVVRNWNEAGHRNSRGAPWTTWTVRRFLVNPRIAGLRATRQETKDPWEIVGPGVWPPLIDEEMWLAITTLFADPSRKTTPDTRRKYLLSSLAVCGVCGGGVKSGGRSRRAHGDRPPGPQKPTYICKDHNHFSRIQAPIDDYVVAVLMRWLNRPEIVARLRARDEVEDLGDARAELATVRIRRDQLADLLADGTLTPDQVRQASIRLNGRINDLELHIGARTRSTAVSALLETGDVEAAWLRFDIDQRRAVVKELATVRITSPGQGVKRFVPESVLVEPAF
jgi:site-specific DNA recombinase